MSPSRSTKSMMTYNMKTDPWRLSREESPCESRKERTDIEKGDHIECDMKKTQVSKRRSDDPLEMRIHECDYIELEAIDHIAHVDHAIADSSKEELDDVNDNAYEHV